MTSRPTVWSDDDNVPAICDQPVAPGERRSTTIQHRAALACHSCRSLHARCDGQTPTCNRCKEEQRACHYPKSRRRRTLAQPLLSPSTDVPSIQRYRLVSATPETVQAVPSETLQNAPLSMSIEWTTPPTPPTPPTPTPCGGPGTEPAYTVLIDTLKQWIHDCEPHRSIDSYYYFFHKAHPFAPTKVYMLSRIQSQDTSAIPLYAAMNYVGCMYQQSSPGRDLKSLALQQTCRDQQAQNISSPRHIYQVATLLLLAIVFYGKGELGEASDCLEKAISLSIDIGMSRVDLITELHDREFAELWKRTYWYLYIMAEALEDTGTNRDFRLECPAPDFPLPGTDDEGGCYKSAQNSSQLTLSRFDVADFEDQAPVFSSLVYLITLVRTSRSIKRLVKHSRDRLDRAAIRANALLMNWKLHLPLGKQRGVTKNGEIDDIMLQSHILFYSLRMFVHTSLPDSSGDGNEPLHTRTILEAAEAGVSLLTLHPCLLQMSPLNIKPLSRCAVTGLNTAPPVESDFHSRDDLRLVLGALKQVSAVWKTAELESQALKAMARIAYSIPGVHTQAIPTKSPTSPVDIYPGDVNFQFTDTSYSDQYGDVGTEVEVGNISMSMPFFESVSGPLEEASVFSW